MHAGKTIISINELIVSQKLLFFPLEMSLSLYQRKSFKA